MGTASQVLVQRRSGLHSQYEQRAGLRGRAPYLYVAELARGSSSRRQPGGSRSTDGLPGPMQIDLYGRRMSFTWQFSRGKVVRQNEVRLVTVGEDRALLGSVRSDADSLARYLSPQGVNGRIVYGYQRVRFRQEATAIPQPGGGHVDAVRTVEEPVTSLLLRYRLTTGDKDVVSDPVGQPLLALAKRKADMFFVTRPGQSYTRPDASTQVVRDVIAEDRWR